MVRLSSDPAAGAVSLSELVGIANAIESEAVARYRWLATQMRRRGESDAAEAFDALAAEEGRHIDAVASWAREIGEPVPEGDFAWRLPKDLAGSWDEIAGSALLTAYRAYSIAVENEERAFAFYAYLAASSDNPRIAAQAEALATEELMHAAQIRVWRRAAFHRERSRRPVANDRGDIGLDSLLAVIAEREAEIATCHDALADRLRLLGDEESAVVLRQSADQARRRAAGADVGDRAAEACSANRPIGLLVAAQRPLERLCERLETSLLSAPSDDVRATAQDAIEAAVARLARIGRRIEQLENTPGD